jgi:hypothetical protein
MLPSVIRLIGQLQAQGLTAAMLNTFVQACYRQDTGRCIFHVCQGRIVGFELPIGRQDFEEQQADDNSCLTNLT